MVPASPDSSCCSQLTKDLSCTVGLEILFLHFFISQDAQACASPDPNALFYYVVGCELRTTLALFLILANAQRIKINYNYYNKQRKRFDFDEQRNCE